MQFQWNFAHTLPTRARIYYTRRRCSAVLARRFFGKSNIQNCCPAGLLSMQPPLHPPPSSSLATTQRDNSSTAPLPPACHLLFYTNKTNIPQLSSDIFARPTRLHSSLPSPLSPRNSPSSLTVLSEFSRTSGLLHLFAEIVVEKLAQLMKF